MEIVTIDTAVIQNEYTSRIQSRDPKKVIEYFAQTGVAPNKNNLKQMLVTQDKMQEVLNIKYGDMAPVEARFWNIYCVFSGLSQNLIVNDLIEQYLGNSKN